MSGAITDPVIRARHLSQYVDLLVELCARDYTPELADRTERAITELEAAVDAVPADAASNPLPRGICRTCGRDYTLTTAGLVRAHVGGSTSKACRGGGQRPDPRTESP